MTSDRRSDEATEEETVLMYPQWLMGVIGRGRLLCVLVPLQRGARLQASAWKHSEHGLPADRDPLVYNYKLLWN